ncbi:MAG: outer membrane protein transport protein [Pseudomonadota bacterium]
MKKYLLASAATALMASAASAGGLDRSNQNSLVVFNDPGEVSFSFGVVTPNVTGRDTTTNTEYDAAKSYTQTALSFTGEINDQLTYTIAFDQPFGVDTSYNGDPTSDRLAGTLADVNTSAITGWLRYQVDPRFSVFGGVRAQRLGGTLALNGQAYAGSFAGLEGGRVIGGYVAGAAQQGSTDALTVLGTPEFRTILGGIATGQTASLDQADLATVNTALNNISGVSVPVGSLTLNSGSAAISTGQTVAGNTAGPTGTFVSNGGYRAELEDTWAMGYSLGAAYEIPDIALRVALTYNSEITHEGKTVESGVSSGGATTDITEVTTPQSINLDFQTGIAADTLLTAGVRWAEWGSFDVIPPMLNSDLADLDDSLRYTVGVARRFSDAFSGSATILYEAAQNDDNVSPLGPTDGLIGITLGGRYESDGFVFSGGLNYTWVGDADAGVRETDEAEFRDNTVVGLGFQVSYTF